MKTLVLTFIATLLVGPFLVVGLICQPIQVICLIIAITVGVLIGKDANSRGMNGNLWGFLVASLMIVFLPVYVIVRNEKE